MSIAITTPTGHIGSRVTRRLFDAGEDLTLLVRSPEKLPADIREKARLEVGDLTDADFVARATKGAESLFWLTFVPFTAPDPRGAAAHFASVAANAVRANRIPYVVNLSSFGAHHATGYGPVSNMQMVENALNDAGENVLHLRPGSFMENYLMQLPS
ncbi:MAG: NAD(P)H-binding protein, partial [Armatimonadota bacterium]|nr:NAD(P)H-binding protein [Armatimonadota bacterium]